MKPYIFYQTKTKFTNTGDALINKALIDILRSYGHVIANNDKIPKNFLNELGIRDNELLKNNSKFGFTISILLFALKAIFKKQRVYIFSGLGHNYGGSYKKIIRNVISGFLFPILRCFGVQIIRIGISIGPITKTLAVSEAFRSLFVTHYYVRDTKSLALCHSIGIKKAKLCPDLSWIYMVTNSTPLENATPTIIVNLRNSTLDEFVYDSYMTKLINKLETLLDAIQRTLEKEIAVKVIYQVREDKDFAEFVSSKLREKYNVHFEKEQMSLITAEDYYGGSLFTISNRMHSLLFAYKFDSLPIALIDKTEHIKITSTFIDAEIEDLICDIQDTGEFYIDKIIKNRDEYLKQIKTVENFNQTIIKKILDEIFNCARK